MSQQLALHKFMSSRSVSLFWNNCFTSEWNLLLGNIIKLLFSVKLQCADKRGGDFNFLTVMSGVHNHLKSRRYAIFVYHLSCGFKFTMCFILLCVKPILNSSKSLTVLSTLLSSPGSISAFGVGKVF